MSIRTLERRTVAAHFEVRENADGTVVGFRGYAAVWDQVAHGEVCRRGMFDKTLAEMADVRFLVNHAGVPLARTKSGTMRLSIDDRGLVVEVDELDMANPTVQELVSAMRRGDIDQMSFAFWPIRETVNDAGVRELLEVKLADVSVVTYPWYDETSAELNGIEPALLSLRSQGPATSEARAALTQAYRRGMVAIEDRDLGDWTLSDARPLLYGALDTLLGSGPGEPYYYWYWIADVSDTWFVYCDERPNADQQGLFQIDYSIDADGTVTLGSPSKVLAKTTYIADPEPDPAPVNEPRGMSPAQARSLIEAGLL